MFGVWSLLRSSLLDEFMFIGSGVWGLISCIQKLCLLGEKFEINNTDRHCLGFAGVVWF
jgi:hypothetical protein